MPDAIRLAAGIAVGAAAAFTFLWLSTRSALKDMTKVERAQAQIREDERKRARLSPKQWFLQQLTVSGYRGDPAPIVLGLSFAYLVVTYGLTLAGLADPLAATFAIPGVSGVGLLARSIWWSKRRKTFSYQLKQLFDLLRGQLEAGYGTQRALELTVPTLPDPLRTEFQLALDSTRAGKDLISALNEVRSAFPSRGFDLFIAALEVDREQGGSLSKTLHRASDMLAAEFKLQEQSDSELASAKQTFWGVIGILTFITFRAVAGADELAREAYFSPIGLTVLAVLAANAAFGVWTTLRIFRDAGGEL